MLDKQDLQAISDLIDAKLTARFQEMEDKLDAKLDAKFAAQTQAFDAKLDARFAAQTQAFDAKLDARTEELKAFVREDVRQAIRENNLAIADIVTEVGDKVTENLTKRLDRMEERLRDVEQVAAQNAYDVQLYKARRGA